MPCFVRTAIVATLCLVRPGAAGVTAATNDIGIMTLPDGRHLAVAVFLTDSRGDDAARDKIIARVGRAAWETWVAATVRPNAAPSRPR